MALLSLLGFFWNLIVGICDYVYQVVVWIMKAVKKSWRYFQDCLCDRVRNRGYQLLPNWSISYSLEQEDEVDFTPQKSKTGWVDFLRKIVGRPKVLRFHVMVIGNDMNCHKDILSRLDISSQDEEISADQSDVIIAFVPIVSRAGTDIQAALQKIPENRPVVFMVLHHTFNPDYIAPDSSREIRRSNVFSVDLLFHEDQGMLNCKRNTEALDKAKKYLQDIQVNYNDKLQC